MLGCSRAYTRSQSHTCTSAHTQTHTRIHAHAHTHTHTRKHTHMPTRPTPTPPTPHAPHACSSSASPRAICVSRARRHCGRCGGGRGRCGGGPEPCRAAAPAPPPSRGERAGRWGRLQCAALALWLSKAPGLGCTGRPFQALGCPTCRGPTALLHWCRATRARTPCCTPLAVSHP